MTTMLKSIRERITWPLPRVRDRQPVTVFVIVAHYEFDNEIAGVFETRGKAWAYLEAKAKAAGKSLYTGKGGTCDIGSDWYTVQAFVIK